MPAPVSEGLSGSKIALAVENCYDLQGFIGSCRERAKPNAANIEKLIELAESLP